MKLTKYEHACFTLEKEGELLVIDPGVWTTDLGAPKNVVGVVVTHEHPDHFDPDALSALISHNPRAIIYAHESITTQLSAAIPTKSVASGSRLMVESFQLQFFGGDHAVIHTDIPRIANLGVLINESVYYPGDSFSLPKRPVDVLALPVAAPWMKFSEAVDFARAIKPRLIFPTHDAILSDDGKQLVDTMVPQLVSDSSYHRPRSSIDV